MLNNRLNMKIILVLIFTLHCFANDIYYKLDNIKYEDSESIEGSGESLDLFDIQSEDIESLNSSSGSIDDLLKTSPLATTARGPRSSSESPQVRGLDNNKIFVMIDGARQRFQSAHTSMIGLDTENIKAINIYKSSSETNYSQSLGGGVNFITIDPEDVLRNKDSASEFKFKLNSANSEKAVNAKSAIRKNKLSSVVSVSYADAKDLELNNGQKLENSSYRDFSALGKINFKNFSLKLEHFNRNDDSPIDGSLNPPSTSKYKSLFSKNKTMRNNISLSYKKKKDIDVNAYINQYKQIKERESFTDTRNLLTTGLNLNKKINKLDIGLDTFFDRLDSDRDGNSISSYPKANSNNSNLYISQNIDLLNRVQLTLNAKQHFYKMDSKTKSINSSRLTKGIKTNFKINSHLNLTASFSEGFNSPRVNEVYAEGLHSNGDGFWVPDNYFITNESLTEETSNHYELGFSFSKDLFQSNALLDIQANIYKSDLKNYIYLNRLDFEGTTQFINIPSAELSGGEISANYIYDAYDLKFSYLSVRGRNLTRNIYLEDLPADNFNFQFRYDWEKYSISLGYLGHYSLEQDRVNLDTIQRTDPTGDYYIHNLFMNKSFKDFDLGLRVDNLFNKEYRRHASHLYESERDIKLSIKYRVNQI